MSIDWCPWRDHPPTPAPVDLDRLERQAKHEDPYDAAGHVFILLGRHARRMRLAEETKDQHA